MIEAVERGYAIPRGNYCMVGNPEQGMIIREEAYERMMENEN